MSESLTHDETRWELRFERQLEHPPEKVWRVLTEPAELAHWFPAAIEGERHQGAALRFVFAGTPGPSQAGVMRVFEPPRLLEYSWADETLRWEIVADPNGVGCTLLFTHIIQDRSTVSRSAAGWDLCIDRMRAWLEGATAGAPHPSWPERYVGYLDRFGFGDFPDSLRSTDSKVDSFLGMTPGPDAHRFKGPSGRELILWRASRDTDVASHRYDREVYLLVIEGSFALKLGGAELVLQAGREFHFPAGLPIAGTVKAGTRGLFGLAANRASE